MSNKKIYYLIPLLIIVIFGVFVSCLFIRKTTKNTNINLVIYAYENDQLGLSFEYPKYYPKPTAVYVSDKQDGQGVLKGKGIRISFPGTPGLFYFLAASKDYEGFKEDYYRDDFDQSRLCPQIGVYDAKDMSLCKSINIAGQEAFERYFVVADEGVAFVNRAVYLNLSGTDYTGLTVSQTYPNLAVPLNDLLSAENEKEFAAQAESMINDLSRKENLPTPVGEQVDDFEQMLNTLKVGE